MRLIIGSDQVAVVGGRDPRQTGNFDIAVAQLKLMRGKPVHFHTAYPCLTRALRGQQTALVPIISAHARIQ